MLTADHIFFHGISALRKTVKPKLGIYTTVTIRTLAVFGLNYGRYQHEIFQVLSHTYVAHFAHGDNSN